MKKIRHNGTTFFAVRMRAKKRMKNMKPVKLRQMKSLLDANGNITVSKSVFRVRVAKKSPLHAAILSNPKLLLWAYLVAKKPVFVEDPSKFSMMAWNLTFKQPIQKLDSATISAREAFEISENQNFSENVLAEISEILQNVVPPREKTLAEYPNGSTFSVY